MTSIEERYKSVLKTDLNGLAKNTSRKFAFTLKSLGIEYAHGLLFDKVLDEITSEKDMFAGEYFGTPMWDNLILDPAGENLRIDMVLMNVSMSKNIKKTALEGFDGTVKEYIADGDYSVGITGALFSKDNIYPRDSMLKLNRLLKKKASIRVRSNFLQLFSINDIVIENYKFEAKESVGDSQFFEINAVSDLPIELIFSNSTI